MKHLSFRRTAAALLALVLVLPLLGRSARAADPFIELVATDITLDETEFTYTGQEIRPNVTVRVNGQLLTLDKDYYLEYADNIEIGEAKVIVTGIATSGYAGTVEHPFFILEAETEPEVPETTEPETSEPTQPETTEPTVPETTEPTVPETTEPTVPETTEPTQPEESEPTEPAKPQYKITKGNKSSWTQGSSAALSFTADGPFDAFTGVSIDGKELDKSHYEAKAGTVVLLKNAYLKTLKTGAHTVAIHFGDSSAEGTFTVAAADENPKTGDSIFLWLSLLMVTGTCLAALKKKTA